MTQRRIFLMINLALVAAGGFCVYYLANVNYARPPEIRDALQLGRETADVVSATEAKNDPRSRFPHLENIRIFNVLYKLTPSPSPTARPTATPIPIAVVLHPWQIRTMDNSSVSFTDRSTNEQFKLSIGGEARTVVSQGRTYKITLQSIDMRADPPQARVKSNFGSTLVIKFEL